MREASILIRLYTTTQEIDATKVTNSNGTKMGVVGGRISSKTRRDENAISRNNRLQSSILG